MNTKLQNLMQEQKENEAATLTIKHTFEIKLNELKNKQNTEDENSMHQHNQALDALRSKLLKDHIEEKDNLKKEYMKKKNVLENLQKKERKRNNMQHNEQEKLHAQQDKDLQHQLDEMSNKNDALNASLSKSKHDVDVLKKEMHNRIFTMEEQYQKEAIDATNKINELKAQNKREKKPVQFNVQVEKENKTSSISNKCTHDNCQCTDSGCLVRAPTLQASSSTSSTEWYWKPCCWFSFVLVLLLGYLFNQERNFTKNNSTKFDSTNQNWDVKLKTLKSSHARALTSCETNSKTQVVSLNAKLKDHQQSIATINKQCTINIEKMKMKTEKNCEISETKIIQGLQNSCDKETTALENQLKTKQSELVAIQKSNDAAVAKAIAATNKECLAKMNVAATKLNKEHLVQQKATVEKNNKKCETAAAKINQKHEVELKTKMNGAVAKETKKCEAAAAKTIQTHAAQLKAAVAKVNQECIDKINTATTKATTSATQIANEIGDTKCKKEINILKKENKKIVEQTLASKQKEMNDLENQVKKLTAELATLKKKQQGELDALTVKLNAAKKKEMAGLENQVKTVQKKIDGLKKQHQSELDALTTTDTHESQHIDLSPIVIKAHCITKQRSILTLITPFILILHTPITAKVFALFTCHRIGGPDRMLRSMNMMDRKTMGYLKADYGAYCLDIESHWSIIIFYIFAFIFLAVVTVGFPIALSVYMYKRKDKLYTYEVWSHIGFIYERFHHGAEFTDLHILMYKTCLCAGIVLLQGKGFNDCLFFIFALTELFFLLSVFFFLLLFFLLSSVSLYTTDFPAMQRAVGTAIATCYLTWYAYVKPMRNPFVTNVCLYGIATTCFFYLSSNVFAAGSQSSHVVKSIFTYLMIIAAFGLFVVGAIAVYYSMKLAHETVKTGGANNLTKGMSSTSLRKSMVAEKNEKLMKKTSIVPLNAGRLAIKGGKGSNSMEFTEMKQDYEQLQEKYDLLESKMGGAVEKKEENSMEFTEMKQDYEQLQEKYDLLESKMGGAVEKKEIKKRNTNRIGPTRSVHF